MTVVIIVDSLLYNYLVVDSFVSFVFDWLWILSISLKFRFNRGLFLLIAGSTLKNSLTKWQSPQLRIPETNHSFSEKWHPLVPQFCLFDHTVSCFVCSSLHLRLSFSVAHVRSSTWFHCALWSAFGLLRKFLHSLILSHYHSASLYDPVQNTTLEGVLSLCWCSLTLTLTNSTGI